jgi:GT2 family glycosyltransferase
MDLSRWYEMTLYGRQITDGKDDPGQYHRCGFTIDSLRKELENAGFVIDYIEKYDGHDTPSLEVRAVKAVSEVKVGWVGAGLSLEIPQYRIRTFHIDRYLRSRGYRSKIIGYDTMLNYDIIIFGRGQNDYAHMLQAKKAGKRVIYDLCESLWQFNEPRYCGAIECADLVVCCSTRLAEEVKQNTKQKNIMVIEDAVEADFVLNCSYEVRERLVVGWIGMGGNVYHANRLRPLIESLGYDLVTIHEHDDADEKWDIECWQKDLSLCDIAIAPLDYEKQPAKSNNRITTYMALGIPTIASPLPAYEEIIQHGVNGFITDTDKEWKECLKSLRCAKERKRIGLAGKRAAREYSLSIIGQKWVDVLIEQSVDKTVDIIVTTYGGGKYLDACLKSIKENTNHPHNVIVVDAKEKGTNFSQTINEGIRQGKAPYVCFLNDDVIVTEGWLSPLVEQIKGNVGFCNPLSNCDKLWLHQYEMNVNGVDLGPGTTIMNDDGNICLKAAPDLITSPESLYDYYPSTSQRRIYYRDWVAFFCTVVPRDLINKVGLLDEEFRTGSEDLDYSTRAGKFGYTCCINENSFVFHFGGVSRKAHEEENYVKHQEEDKYNNDRIKFKYDHPLIVIQTGWTYKAWDANTLREKGLGGSETWAVHMAEEMAKLGPRVVVIAQTGKDRQIINGVEWLDQKDYQQFVDMNWIDVFVVSRYVDFLRKPVRAGKRYLILHDIFAIPGHGEGKEWVKEVYDSLDGIFVLSPWHKQFAAQWHGVPEDKFIITANGIDLSRFENQNQLRSRVQEELATST